MTRFVNEETLEMLITNETLAPSNKKQKNKKLKKKIKKKKTLNGLMFSVRFFVSQLQIIIITESDFNVLKTEMYLQVLVIMIIGQRSKMGLR